MSNIKGKSKNYYRLLNLKKNATSNDIIISYQKLITHWNKYINKSPIANERIKDIKEAYYVLSNPIKRRKYDLKINKKKIHERKDINDNILNINDNIIDNFKSNFLDGILSSVNMMSSFIPITTQIKVIDLSDNINFNKSLNDGPEIELLN